MLIFSYNKKKDIKVNNYICFISFEVATIAISLKNERQGNPRLDNGRWYMMQAFFYYLSTKICNLIWQNYVWKERVFIFLPNTRGFAASICADRCNHWTIQTFVACASSDVGSGWKWKLFYRVYAQTMSGTSASLSCF